MQTIDHLDELLRGITRSLDIPPELQLEATRRYRHLGEWLEHHYGVRWRIEIYPQGSMRLGTVVRPDFEIEQYDLDMVLVIDIDKENVSKQDLRDSVGDLLNAYIDANNEALPCVPKLQERGRCWTLDFGEIGFHMDVLPAVPNREGAEHAIAITDRDLHHWQYSNPIAYADWFLAKNPTELFDEARLRVAAWMKRSIEEVPTFLVRTPLQRAVQIVKRHRDLHFAGDPTIKPASVLLTTLVAQSYAGGRDLKTILQDFLKSLPDLIRKENGQWIVANPVEPNENFADKWNTSPERHEAFYEWTAQLRVDLEEAFEATGLDKIAARLGTSFGAKPVAAAASALGAAIATAPATITRAGRVNTVSPTSRTVPHHTFHGPRPPHA
jgi:hypothetical protein